MHFQLTLIPAFIFAFAGLSGSAQKLLGRAPPGISSRVTNSLASCSPYEHVHPSSGRASSGNNLRIGNPPSKGRIQVKRCPRAAPAPLQIPEQPMIKPTHILKAASAMRGNYRPSNQRGIYRNTRPLSHKPVMAHAVRIPILIKLFSSKSL
ncbi:hypothetical protein CROQUDRAFT_106608 [Cronartium quercuum f. sp. fusiforme G11]|uniref:Secreted protein n=1 Tax=Cronartium quercuum f. sp. fusiforme G11 TaxID=708437 RepID=A0A9P6TCA3_9BASI|nr:hypothetical protein CROQUDRAFT_106608 [Cronartium quercuum f. sp. fusiforme G11]